MKKKILLIIGLCLIFLMACSPSDKKEEPKGEEEQVNNKDVKDEAKESQEDSNKSDDNTNKEAEPKKDEAKTIEPEKSVEEVKPEEAKPKESKPEEAKPEESAKKIKVDKDFEAELYMTMLFENKDNVNYTYNKETKQNIATQAFNAQVDVSEKVMYDGSVEVKSSKSKSQNQESNTNIFTDVSGKNHVVYTQVSAGGIDKITKVDFKNRKGNMPILFDTQFNHMFEKYKWKYDEALSNGNIMAFTKIVKDAQIDEYNSDSLGKYKNSKGHIKSTLYMDTNTGMVHSFEKHEKFKSDFEASKEAESYGAVSGKLETDTTYKITDIQFGKAPKLTIPDEVIKNAIESK